ncbi:MAG: hypothetical protein IT179_13435 [Acidobacteria bacterium]|nr:hypothetical protein [Acidobacteriota bacterium]
MHLRMTRQFLTALSLAGVLAFVAACSGPSSSLSPTGPTPTAASSATGGANFSPNPTPEEPPPPPCEEVSGATSTGTEPEPCEPPPPPPPPPGDEGCTPGYWKNHLDSWGPTGYTPGQSLTSVFGANALSGSLLDGLGFGGGPGVTGAKRILLRAAVAALLNAAHPGVAYTQSAASVIASVNAALASGSRDTMLALASSLDRDNNLGCPLN